MSAEAWFLDTAAVAAGIGLVAGLLVPELVARIPEPASGPGGSTDQVGGEREGADPLRGRGDEPTSPTGARTDPNAGVAEAGPGLLSPDVPEPKERYADIAVIPGLRWRTAPATAVAAGLLGARIGWDPALAIFLYLAPVGVALALVDWRTRLLPTKVIAPSYAVVLLLAVVASWATGDWDSLTRAGWGWLVAGGTFFALWFVYPKGMGYGDVRLSGVLGIALGFLGWAELVTGVYAGFLLGGVGGLLLSALRVVDRKACPFGPFMLAGTLLGVLLGPYVAGWYV